MNAFRIPSRPRCLRSHVERFKSSQTRVLFQDDLEPWAGDSTLLGAKMTFRRFPKSRRTSAFHSSDDILSTTQLFCGEESEDFRRRNGARSVARGLPQSSFKMPGVVEVVASRRTEAGAEPVSEWRKTVCGGGGLERRGGFV